MSTYRNYTDLLGQKMKSIYEFHYCPNILWSSIMQINSFYRRQDNDGSHRRINASLRKI